VPFLDAQHPAELKQPYSALLLFRVAPSSHWGSSLPATEITQPHLTTHIPSEAISAGYKRGRESPHHI